MTGRDTQRRTGPRLAVEQHVLDGTYVVIARGEIDLATAEPLGGALQEALNTAQPAVVVDLMQVEFMDSSGLHLLLNTLRRLTRQSRTLAVACCDGPVRRVFDATRLADTFAIRPSREAALAAVSEP